MPHRFYPLDHPHDIEAFSHHLFGQAVIMLIACNVVGLQWLGRHGLRHATLSMVDGVAAIAAARDAGLRVNVPKHVTTTTTTTTVTTTTVTVEERS